MKCQNVRETFADFLTGELDSRKKGTVQEHLAECSECRKELESLTEIWTKLGVLSEELPSSKLRSRFYSMLEEYRHEKNAPQESLRERLGAWTQRLWPRKPVFQFSLALGLLVVGLIIGNLWDFNPIKKSDSAFLREEVQNMRQNLAVSLLEQTSPSERLRGINLSAVMEKPGEKLVGALLATLNDDSNVNVRLAAVEALYLFYDHPTVKEGLIQSLANQTSPLVQASLIDLMVSIRERKAVDSLKSLLQMEGLNPDIKNMAEIGIQQLDF